MCTTVRGRRCLVQVLLAVFVADGCMRAHQRCASGPRKHKLHSSQAKIASAVCSGRGNSSVRLGVRLRGRTAEKRDCGQCKNATATYGVVGETGGSGHGWTLVLCRKCARLTAAGEREGKKVLRLAGRCARCRMFAIYGAAPGLRTHCRCQSPCHQLPPPWVFHCPPKEMLPCALIMLKRDLQIIMAYTLLKETCK